MDFNKQVVESLINIRGSIKANVDRLITYLESNPNADIFDVEMQKCELEDKYQEFQKLQIEIESALQTVLADTSTSAADELYFITLQNTHETENVEFDNRYFKCAKIIHQRFQILKPLFINAIYNPVSNSIPSARVNGSTSPYNSISQTKDLASRAACNVDQLQHPKSFRVLQDNRSHVNMQQNQTILPESEFFNSTKIALDSHNSQEIHDKKSRSTCIELNVKNHEKKSNQTSDKHTQLDMAYSSSYNNHLNHKINHVLSSCAYILHSSSQNHSKEIKHCINCSKGNHGVNESLAKGCRTFEQNHNTSSHCLSHLIVENKDSIASRQNSSNKQISGEILHLKSLSSSLSENHILNIEIIVPESFCRNKIELLNQLITRQCSNFKLNSILFNNFVANHRIFKKFESAIT